MRWQDDCIVPTHCETFDALGTTKADSQSRTIKGSDLATLSTEIFKTRENVFQINSHEVYASVSAKDLILHLL